MWEVVVIIVIVILGKFLLDTSKQSNEIKAQGGLSRKYSFLINKIMPEDEKTTKFEDPITGILTIRRVGSFDIRILNLI